MALPAVTPVTVRDPHTDSHRVGGRWNCKPEISNAQDSSAFRRRRMSSREAVPFTARRLSLSNEVGDQLTHFVSVDTDTINFILGYEPSNHV